MNQIEKVKINIVFDESPDLSYIGQYTNKAQPWHICRRCGQFLHIAERYDRIIDAIDQNSLEIENRLHFDGENLEIDHYNRLSAIVEAMEKVKSKLESFKHDCTPFSREYNFFIPAQQGVEQGSADFIKYGIQVYERMEAYNSEQWHFVGIQAQATVSRAHENGHKQLQNFLSCGLWGIESDSGMAYFKEIAQEELENLKKELESYSVDLSNWDALTKDLQLDMDL